MNINEMIKIMQHYADGGAIQRCNFGSHNYSDITIEGYLFNFCDYKYRIKESKQKVTIEKWLGRSGKGDYIILEASNVNLYKGYELVKLIKSYEVELWKLNY